MKLHADLPNVKSNFHPNVPQKMLMTDASPKAAPSTSAVALDPHPLPSRGAWAACGVLIILECAAALVCGCFDNIARVAQGRLSRLSHSKIVKITFMSLRLSVVYVFLSVRW